MKIYNITPYNLQYKKINTNSQNVEIKNEQTKSQQYEKLPSTMQYLAFTGGYSLDLGQTIKQLDKLSQKNFLKGI